MASQIDGFLEDFYVKQQNCAKIERLIPDKEGNLTLLPMSSCYINLAVVNHFQTESDGIDADTKRPATEQKEFRELRDTFNRPRSSEELNLTDVDGNHYQIEDLFDSSSNYYAPSETSRRIFMLGKAGIGKTTMCKKIVYEYYVNRCWQEKFDRIVWLPLRIFNRESVKNSESSLDGLYSNHFRSNSIEDDPDFGRKLAEQNGIDESRVLYLLDGLDEIQNLVGIDELPVSRIIDDLLSKPYVIVTSRPYTYHSNFSNFDIILETIGFSQENILDYVRMVYDQPTDNETQKEIVEFIEKSPANIAGMVSIPILLDIICFTWTDIKNIERENTTITMTRLYSILDKYLWGQFLMRMDISHAELWRNTGNTKREVYDLISRYTFVDVHTLAELAYKMLTMNKIEFTTEEAFGPQDIDSHQRILLKNTNFLNCLNPSEESIKEMLKSYSFVHLTIQEYLSAVYLVKCFKENRQIFEDAIIHKYNPRYSIVWSFVAGILADSNDELKYTDNDLLLDTFFNFLERNPRDELGIAHQYLIVGCLNECSYPCLLSTAREERLINELFSYIFTQYVAGGKSLFKLQLPVKVLHKLLSQPDAHWEGDEKAFRKNVLREQFLPEEITKRIINETLIGQQDRSKSERMRANILNTQSYLGLQSIGVISDELNKSIDARASEMIERYLNILESKSFLPSDDKFLVTIGKCITYAAPKAKDFKRKVVNVCLNLKEVPFDIFEKLVLNYSTGFGRRERNVSDENWKREILMGLIRDDGRIFPSHVIMQAFKQKCFAHIVDDFLNEKISEENLNHLHRLLLVAARRNLSEETLLKLLNFVEADGLQYDVKRLILYTIGNMKKLPNIVFNGLFRKLDENDFEIELPARNSRKLIYPRPHRDDPSDIVIDFAEFGIESSPMDSSECVNPTTNASTKPTDSTQPPPINFQYLAFVIPLMKSEFYDQYRKKRSIFQFKKRRYLSHSLYDLKHFGFLHRNIVDAIDKALPTIACKIQLHDELLATWSEFKSSSDTWENVFAGWHLENGNSIRHGRQFKLYFSYLLDDEWDIDSKAYYDVLVAYRQLVTRAHYLYNTPSETAESDMEHFEKACEVKLLGTLIIRALRDSEISVESLQYLRSQLLEQMESERSKLGSLAKILEFKALDSATISKIIDFIDTGSVDEVSLTLSLLHRQTINESADADKLTTILLTDSTDTVVQQKCRLVENVFAKNPKLLRSVQHTIRPLIDEDFAKKLKVLNVLQDCVSINDEPFLLQLPDIIKDCRDEPNWNDITGRCVFTLLNQKSLPAAVLDKMVDYFDNLETQYASVFLGFLNLLRTPLTRKCIESLYAAINDGFVSDLRELAAKRSNSELLMMKILKKQPLWNLLASSCSYKFKEKISFERKSHSYTIKERVIVEKITLDHMPMAIITDMDDGKRRCFSPIGLLSVDELADSDFTVLLKSIFERSSSAPLYLPIPLDRHHNYLKFHSAQENLNYILSLEGDSDVQRVGGAVYEMDERNFYIRGRKVRDIASSTHLIDCLTNILQCAEYRHVDLRDNNLNDADVHHLLNSLLRNSNNASKRIVSLILSNNKISVRGFGEMLEQLKRSQIDFVFFDRNLISFNGAEYEDTIVSTYQSDANVNQNAARLDLSVNFISYGQGNYGSLQQNFWKDSIRKIREIHCQNVGENPEIFQNQIRSYCHWIRHPGERKMLNIQRESQTGCIVVAEKRPKGFLGQYIYNRGHAFMVIEWIPDAEFGQRQIILAELGKDELSRLKIRITTADPLELKRRLEDCVSSRTIVKTNEEIATKLLPAIITSSNQIEIFDYTLVPSVIDRRTRGRLNCISWTDDMLATVNITVDSMQRDRTRITIFKSIFVAFISVIFYFAFRIMHSIIFD